MICLDRVNMKLEKISMFELLIATYCYARHAFIDSSANECDALIVNSFDLGSMTC